MLRIFVYSVLLITGMSIAQILDLHKIEVYVHAATMICLSYIMLEVGLEFTLDKRNMKKYAVDYLVAMVAATLPWLLTAEYFIYYLGAPWKEALLVGAFAAPTSAGVLFAMLGAAGLGLTWLFKKARILAIFDDLFTIILMIPLQIMYVGYNQKAVLLLFLIFMMFYFGYRYLHKLRFPTGSRWLFVYAWAVVGFCQVIERVINVQFEVLLPAFAFGCLLYNPHDPRKPEKYRHEHEYLEPEKDSARYLDITLKNTFMFLVGLSIPKIIIGDMGVGFLLLNVLIITILSNIGKMFPAFFYGKEASVRERLAVGVAMFPRGEVGAGILLVAMNFGLDQKLISIAGMSLGLNLVLTGVFISIVIKLIEGSHSYHPSPQEEG